MPKPTQTEINEALNTCMDQADQGASKYSGMTFEQGVEYTLRWMTDDGPHPFED